MPSLTGISACLPFALAGGTLLAVVGVFAVLSSARVRGAAAAGAQPVGASSAAFKVVVGASALTALSASGLAVKALTVTCAGGVMSPLEPPPPAHVVSVPGDDGFGVQALGGATEVKCEADEAAVVLERIGPNDGKERVDHFSVCVGVPIQGLQLTSPGWRRWGPVHEHSEVLKRGIVTDRDPGPYQTYVCEFHAGTLSADGQLPELKFRVLSPGAHQVGLGIVRGALPPEGNREPFREHASSVLVVTDVE